MPTLLKVFRLFVIGPSDIEDEREIVKAAIDEVNVLARSAYGVSFEYVGWDTDALNTTGVDAQDVINTSIDDNYDAVLGFLWTRFGTPTGRALSGTEEEYKRAMSRFEAGEIKHILWFIRKDPIVPSDLDVDQYIKLTKFIEKIRGNSLTLDYRISDLEKVLRSQLTTLLTALIAEDDEPNSPPNEIQKNIIIPNNDSKNNLKDEDAIFDDEQPGLLDLRVAFDEAVETFANELGEVSASMEIIGEATKSATEKINVASTMNSTLNPKDIMKILDEPIDALHLYAEESENRHPTIASSFNTMINTFQSLRLLQIEKDGNDPTTLKEAIESLRSSIANCKIGMVSYLESLQSTPPMSKKYNKAKRKATYAVERQIEMLDGQESRLMTILALTV